MGLNLIESFIVAGAAEIILRRHIPSPLEATCVERVSFEVISKGMTRAGYRFEPGLIESPWTDFYEGVTGARFLKEQSR